jgi:lipoprotein-releasing system permease protein
MRYELFIGLRYLRARRRQAFISLITVISTLGLVIGVMTLNIVLAVFTGFEEDLRDRILGFNPHLMVLSFSGEILNATAVIERIEQMPDVVAGSPFVYGQAMLSAGEKVTGAVIRGVPASADKVLELQRYLVAGKASDLGATRPVAAGSGAQQDAIELPAVILGKELAHQLGVAVGDAVNVISPVSTPGALGMVPRLTRFAVVGLFDSGMAEYDASLAYMDMASAQHFFGVGENVTGIEVRVRDPFTAHEAAARIGATLGFPFVVRDWMEINRNLFAALRVGKAVYFIVVLLIVLVAAFNVVSTLIMVVIEKRKDIGVLKSMGATRLSVGRIFVYKGMIIGLVGTVLGNLGALAACLLLQRYRFIELPREVYAIDTLQVRIYPEHFLAVTAASLLICWFSTLYPARQAARLAPVDVIRYE